MRINLISELIKLLNTNDFKLLFEMLDRGWKIDRVGGHVVLALPVPKSSISWAGK